MDSQIGSYMGVVTKLPITIERLLFQPSCQNWNIFICISEGHKLVLNYPRLKHFAFLFLWIYKLQTKNVVASFSENTDKVHPYVCWPAAITIAASNVMYYIVTCIRYRDMYLIDSVPGVLYGDIVTP